MRKPLCIDLFCGLGGWTEGFLAEGYECIGFDIERHDYGTGGYPGQLVLQDVLTLHGSQFRDAAVIVASPPCQFFSYTAMPWSRAKQLAAEVRSDPVRLEKELALFRACFRLQREACESMCHCSCWRCSSTRSHCVRCDAWCNTGNYARHVPLLVENVVGAQAWVGSAAWHFGSYYLWGDVPALMPTTGIMQKFNPDGTNHPQGSWFAVADSKNRGSGGVKVPGLNWSGSDKPGYVAKAFNTTAGQGVKVASENGRRTDVGKGARCGDESVKCGGSWFHEYRTGQGPRNHGSKSVKRKAASAAIAKIPFALSNHIAWVYKPQEVGA